MTTNTRWVVSWPWVVYSVAVANVSMSIEAHHVTRMWASSASELVAGSVAAALALWGFWRLVRTDPGRTTTWWQVLVFVGAIPALAWSNANERTRAMVYLAGFGVALAKLALVHARLRDAPSPRRR